MSVDLDTLQTTLDYRIHGPLTTILSDLEQVAALDRTIKAQTKLYQQWFGWLLVITSLLLFFSFSVPWSFPLTVAAGIGVVVTGWRLNQYRQRGMPSYRYQLMPQLLDMISRDLDPQHALDLHLVLSPALKPDKQTPPLQHHGWKVSQFKDSWLRLEGQFLDNTRFLLISTEEWIQKSGSSVGSSGKRKYKTKTKPKGFTFELTLSVPRKIYGAVTMLKNDASAAIKLPRHAILKQLKLSDNRLYLKVKSSIHPLPNSGILNNSTVQSATRSEVNSDSSDSIEVDLYQLITALFLSSYQILNLARTLSNPRLPPSVSR